MKQNELIQEWIFEECIKRAVIGMVEDGATTKHIIELGTRVLRKVLAEFEKAGERE